MYAPWHLVRDRSYSPQAKREREALRAEKRAFRERADQAVRDRKAALADRRAEIVRRRKAGETLRAIGADYNLSNERIRQIIAQTDKE